MSYSNISGSYCCSGGMFDSQKRSAKYKKYKLHIRLVLWILGVNKVISIHKGKERHCSGYSMTILIKKFLETRLMPCICPIDSDKQSLSTCKYPTGAALTSGCSRPLGGLWGPTEETHFNLLCAPETCWSVCSVSSVKSGEMSMRVSQTHYHTTGAVLNPILCTSSHSILTITLREERVIFHIL